MTAFHPSNINNRWGVNAIGIDANGGGTVQTITGVTTTLPNSVSMGFWSVAANNTWGALTAGWTRPWGATTQFRNSVNQSHTAAYKIMAAAGATGSPAQTQLVSATALRSLVSWSELSNDNCTDAISLGTGAACTNTAGMVAGATLSGGIPLPICGTPLYDVWYKFVATSTVESITLSGLGANFTNPGIQVLSGACGTLSTVTCATGTAATAPSLTIGTTYYVRVYSTSAPTSLNGNFSICVVDAPANDDCSGAVSLTSNQACNPTNGTLTNSTNLSIGACNATRPDVWYSFTAQTVNPVITIGGALANMRFQVLSGTGTCGGPLNSIFCSTGSSQTVSPNLTIGTTYYVRVFSTSVATGNFTICVDDAAPANDLSLDRDHKFSWGVT
jgi:hypothetical protein